MKSFINTSSKMIAIIISVIFLVGLCSCTEKTITSVESLRLSTSSYHSGGTVYEIAEKDGEIELCRYRVVYSGSDEKLELEQSAICDTQELIELMNTCKVAKWNGFDKNNSTAMDGTSFTLTATVNNGEKIRAEGYAEFPNNYGKFVSGLEKFLKENGTIEQEETTEPEVEEPITKMESMMLYILDDEDGIVYEATDKDNQIELCYYLESTGIEELKQSVLCDTQEFLDLMNSCNVSQWDGFYDEDDDASNGTLFNLAIDLGNEEFISAGGCDKFPDGYDKFVAGLEKILEENNNDSNTAEKITSVESMKLSTGSYHSSANTVLELTNKGDEVELCRYRVTRSGSDSEQVLEKSAVCDTEKFIEIMNKYDVANWDGFDMSNQNVMDGPSFTFKATINSGKTINAHGYARTPNGYDAFVTELYNILNAKE